MFQLPAGSSPALSPPPAAAFLADMAVAGAGALGPRTPMHGWGGGLLRDDAILMGGPRRRQSVVQLPYSYCVGGGGDDSVTRTEVGVCGAIRRELQETRKTKLLLLPAHRSRGCSLPFPCSLCQYPIWVAARCELRMRVCVRHIGELVASCSAFGLNRFEHHLNQRQN